MEEHQKHSRTPADIGRIRRESDLLAAARHPGVVELLRLDDHGEHISLVTALVEGRPLASIRSLVPEELAGLGAALATTLADLHELGTVHGAVSADHVIVRHDGSPVLCGFGSGGRIGELVPGRSSPLQPAIDVAGLAAVVRHFAVGPDGRALREVARCALEPETDGASMARRLADRLSTAVPGARLPAPSTAEATAHREPPRPRNTRLGRFGAKTARGIAMAVALIVVLGIWMAATGAVPDSVSTPTTSFPAIGQARAKSITTEPSPAATSIEADRRQGPVTTAPETCPDTVGVLTADVDDDGCEEALSFEGGVLAAGARRWQLGRPGDIVVAGDWSCRGLRTLALLRPATGEVFRFDGWASADRDVVGDPLAQVEGGRAIRPADIDGDGCHELVIERFDGSTQFLEVGMPNQ